MCIRDRPEGAVKYDLIFCRNVMIYFDREAKGKPVSYTHLDVYKRQVTDEERNNNEITQIDVTLSVEEKPNPADKDLVDSKVTANQRIGVYLDIILEKTISKATCLLYTSGRHLPKGSVRCRPARRSFYQFLL